jgi:hypothetical protein
MLKFEVTNTDTRAIASRIQRFKVQVKNEQPLNSNNNNVKRKFQRSIFAIENVRFVYLIKNYEQFSNCIKFF